MAQINNRLNKIEQAIDAKRPRKVRFIWAPDGYKDDRPPMSAEEARRQTGLTVLIWDIPTPEVSSKRITP